jgi:transmembrane sensor
MHDAHDIEAIRAEAERWFARLRGGTCSAAERRAFAAWHAVEAHAAAYAETERLWAGMDALAGDAEVGEWLREARRPGRRAPGGLRRLRWLSAAAAVALACAAGAYYATRPGSVAHYATARGEQRRVDLADGTRLVLNTDTALEVRLGRRERTLRLEKGEAAFEVAHEAGRPFVVHVGDSVVTDLGTRFVVRSDGAQTVVSVLEGEVAVDRAGHATARLTPGEQLAMDGADWQKRRADPATVDAWTQGRLVFRATPLAEAVAQANRYGPGRLVVADASLRDYRISGEFRIGNTDALVRALESAFPIRAEAVGEETRLKRR